MSYKIVYEIAENWESFLQDKARSLIKPHRNGSSIGKLGVPHMSPKHASEILMIDVRIGVPLLLSIS